jgi:hypothetical protein
MVMIVFLFFCYYYAYLGKKIHHPY